MVQGQGREREGLAPRGGWHPAAAGLAPHGTGRHRQAPDRHPRSTPQAPRRVHLRVMPPPCPHPAPTPPRPGATRSRFGATRCCGWRGAAAGCDTVPGRVRQGAGRGGCGGVLRQGAAVRCGGAGRVRRGAVRRALQGCGWRRDGRCGATGRGPPGRVRRAAREGDPPAWGFWLLANGREGHVPTPATNRLVAKPEKKYCGVCPMP